jgi:hypothetical protein
LNDLLRQNKKALLFRIVCVLGVALAVTPAIQAFSEALPDYPDQAPRIHVSKSAPYKQRNTARGLYDENRKNPFCSLKK